MRKLILLPLAVCSALTLGACNSPYPQDRATSGAVLGGATGALLGAAATGRPGGALVGGALGAATGAIVGANSPPPPPPGYYPPPPPPGPCAQFAYDAYGNRICVAHY